MDQINELGMKILLLINTVAHSSELGSVGHCRGGTKLVVLGLVVNVGHLTVTDITRAKLEKRPRQTFFYYKCKWVVRCGDVLKRGQRQ